MQIRVALNSDLEFLNEIIKASKSYWGYDVDFMKKFMEKFALTSDYIGQKNTYVASLETNNVGLYSFSRNKDNQLELDNFFLHPDYIGQGVGKIMWDHCVKSAKSYKDRFFLLWSDPHAEGFYFKMGCEKIGERKSPMMPNRYPAIFKCNLDANA